MDYDKHGFPKPPGFDDQREPVRPKITGARLGLLGLILGVGLVLALAVDVGPNYFADLRAKILPMGTRDVVLRKINVYLFRGDYESALEECNHLIKIDPKDGHLIKAHILSELKRYRETVNEYTKLLEIDPQDASGYNNRAYHRALGRFELEEALTDVEKSLEIAGDVPAYIDTRGYLFYLSGRPQEALVDFNRVLDNPDAAHEMRGQEFGEIYFHRGLVYQSLGDKEKAEKDFALARRLGFKIDNYPEPVLQAKPAVPKGKGEQPLLPVDTGTEKSVTTFRPTIMSNPYPAYLARAIDA